MATVVPKPPAKELAAIAARAAAAGKKPTEAAILATYNRNQARATAPKPAAAPKPPTANAATALSRQAVIARATAAGKKPTAAAVNATLAKNRARLVAAASKKAAMASPLSAPAGEIGEAIGPGTSSAELTPEISGTNDYWNNALARLKAGEAPADVFPESAKHAGQGPEQNLSAQEYLEMVLTQYEGSDNAGNIDVRRGMTPAGIKAWLRYLAKKGPKGYVGVNTGSGAAATGSPMDPAERTRQNSQEWRRNLELAGSNAKLPAGRYGFGYDDSGRPLTDAELIALVRGMK